MNLKNLRDTHHTLLAHMKASDYSESYVCRTEKMVKHILAFCGHPDIRSYEDIYQGFVKQKKTPSTLKCYKGLIGIVQQFYENGLYPNRLSKLPFRLTSNYHKLIPCFKKFVDEYSSVAGRTNKKATTIQGEARNVSSFLAFMQNEGATSLTTISHNMVISYFTDENGYPNKSYSLKKQMTSVFKTCSSLYPSGECERILSCLPKLKKRRKNIPYLTNVEVSMIKSTLTDSASSLSLRNKAIGLLALETGVRCCDIAGLNLSAIDWEKDLIRINQQKTDYPLELPLPTNCGNALHDYIKHERPETNATEVFIRARPPYTRLESRSLVWIAMMVARAANIRQNPGDKCGFHLYRHRLATALLENNVLDVIISKTLGHASPESIEGYLGADFVHLKECALSIEDYPVDLEVVLK